MVHVHPFRFTSADGLSIFCTRWDSGRTPTGVVQIAHGLGEHMGRYAGLVECLVDAGLVVYGNDHRGHGQTAAFPEVFGHFGPGGFDLLVADMHELSCIAIRELPGLPLILLVFTCINQSNVAWALKAQRRLWSTRREQPSAGMPSQNDRSPRAVVGWLYNSGFVRLGGSEC